MMKVLRNSLMAAVVALSGVCAQGQASALPSAAPDASAPADRGRKLIDEMIKALGGDAWLNRKYSVTEGKAGAFYKGQPNPYVVGFRQFQRAQPFAERVVLITHFGTLELFGLPGKDHEDEAVVWDSAHGYEVTFKGKKELPEKEVVEYERRRAHSLDVVVKDWLKQKDVLVSYEGTELVGRRLAYKVSVLTAKNDAVTIDLDESNSLPLALSFQYRDPQFNDIDTDTEQYDGWQPVQGIMTPYTITRLHNGDIVAQHYITKVEYRDTMDDSLFDPNRPLLKKAK